MRHSMRLFSQNLLNQFEPNSETIHRLRIEMQMSKLRSILLIEMEIYRSDLVNYDISSKELLDQFEPNLKIKEPYST